MLSLGTRELFKIPDPNQQVDIETHAFISTNESIIYPSFAPIVNIGNDSQVSLWNGLTT